MTKNILIFADGTGQAGGLRPDQRLSNVYKLYRATRTGPDSPIDPRAQVAYYDPGLGSEGDAKGFGLRLVDMTIGFARLAAGAGITRNVIDCYEAILKYYEPGDRIYLFGFSRGAYTVRTVGGVLNLCGVPTKNADGSPITRYGDDLRQVAKEAVQTVYEHGAGHDRAKFEDEREEAARRFRLKYQSDDTGKANVVPYFIGVFDTVAALGMRPLLLVILIIAWLAITSLSALVMATLFKVNLAAVWIGISAAISGWYLWTTRERLKTIKQFGPNKETRRHIAGWSLKFYDRRLDPRVRFGRHAISIDESRRDFPRVPWGQPGVFPEREPGEPEQLRQFWFAGNHSDIGGSYAEDESRLSDIALAWMVEQATEIPYPIIIDDTKLHLFPNSAGVQHCEVRALAEKYPRCIPKSWRKSWAVEERLVSDDATLHPSVYDRFGCSAVLQCGNLKPYRPNALRNHDKLKQYYDELIDQRQLTIN